MIQPHKSLVLLKAGDLLEAMANLLLEVCLECFGFVFDVELTADLLQFALLLGFQRA